MKLIFHSDPGHGWLEVSLKHLSDYGLCLKDFSMYSFFNPKTKKVFLEEDRDAGIFLDHIRSHGTEPVIKPRYLTRMSRIRNLTRLSAL